MSKVIKGAKKRFRKVTRFVKRYGAAILAAAAIVFTAGAALGAAGMLGAGWGAVGTTVGSAVGGGTLGSVVAGAVTQAGYGAALGGIMAEATGGDFKDGAKSGAVVGAVTGGIGGYMNAPTAQVDTATNAQVQSGAQSAAQPSIESMASNAPQGQMSAAPFEQQSALSSAGQQSAANQTGGLFSHSAFQGTKEAAKGLGNWVGDNQQLVGTMIQGYGAGETAEAKAEAERKAWERKQAQIRDNYSASMPNRRGLMSPVGADTPEDRFSQNRFATNYTTNFEYQFDPQQGRIVRVAVS